MRASRIGVVVLVGALAFVTGCGPAVSKSDLGRVLDEMPKIPGADQAFPIPENAKPTEPGPRAKNAKTPPPSFKSRDYPK